MSYHVRRALSFERFSRALMLCVVPNLQADTEATDGSTTEMKEMLRKVAKRIFVCMNERMRLVLMLVSKVKKTRMRRACVPPLNNRWRLPLYYCRAPRSASHLRHTYAIGKAGMSCLRDYRRRSRDHGSMSFMLFVCVLSPT